MSIKIEYKVRYANRLFGNYWHKNYESEWANKQTY